MGDINNVTDKLGLVNIDIADTPFGYDERVEYGIAMSGNFDILDAARMATTASIQLYVSTTGSDTNPGTWAQPMQTIQAALNRLPKVIRHPTDVYVLSGSYVGARIAGFSIDISEASSDAGPYLLVSGELVPAPVAGLMSGTVTSATAGSTTITSWSTVTVTGAGWTTSALRGKWLKIVSGTGVGQAKVIYDNTASVITVTGTWNTTPDSTSAFLICEPGTEISTAVDYPSELGNQGVAAAKSTGQASFIFNINGHGGTAATSIGRGRVGVRSFKISGGSTGVSAVATGRVGVWGCKITTVTGVSCRQPGSEITINECHGVGTSQFANSGVGGYLDMTNNVVVGGSGIGLSTGCRLNSQVSAWMAMPFAIIDYIGAPQAFLFTTSIVSGTGGAASKFLTRNNATVNSAGVISVTNSSFNSLNTVFDLYGPSMYTLSGLSGASNGTVFSINQGARVKLDSASTITGSVDITLDGGSTQAIAWMRSASPKVLNNSTYFSAIYE